MSFDQFLKMEGYDDDDDGGGGGGGNQTKKRKCDQEEEQGTSWLDLLPHEVALDIISRLPVKSLIQSRFVCKFWHKLSFDPHLASLHLSNELKRNNPYLIFHCDVPIKNQLYFMEFFNHDDVAKQKQEKVRKIDAPFSASMSEFKVIGSCNGIFCLENALFEEAVYLYNPFTRDYTQLPKCTDYKHQKVMYGFGFHPITNQYKLIKIVYYTIKHNSKPYILYALSNWKSDAQIFSLGCNRWRSIGSIPYQLQIKSTAVLMNGRLHWTTTYSSYNGRKDRFIVSFDLSDEIFREVPSPDLGFRRRSNYHLAVLGDCLCAAVPLAAGFGTFDIWILKEYNRKESWVKEIRIGVYRPNLRTQELRNSYGIWRNALTGKMVQVLCLLKNGEVLLEYKGGTLVSYHPETGMFRDITFPGVPNPSKTIVHVGSLNRVGSPSPIVGLV